MMQLTKNFTYDQIEHWTFKYSSYGTYVIGIKFGEQGAKTMEMLNCEEVFDMLNGVAVARQYIYGEL